MFTDMIGYTALGQKNEVLSLALVEEQRKLIRPVLFKHDGREIKTIGDAFLVEFPNAIGAARCAYDIQRRVREFNFSLPVDQRIHLRIGLHVGEIIEAKGDISGDAVNVASRIEALAEDGGVCLTRQVFDHVQNKIELRLFSIGVRSLKNVAAPLEIYKMVMPWDEQKPAESGNDPDKRRIAVLPFASMSPDSGDEYFADGMTEELISTISKIEQFEVISRTSVMQFKKNPKSVREVSKELGVGTVLEGSVRKSGEKLRITIQMIDPARDRHLWAESYDRELRDIFAVQSDIARQVADSLRVRILPKEEAKLEKVPTFDTKAHMLYLKGRYYWNERTKEGIEKAIEYFNEAIKRDPKYAQAYIGLADCYGILENWGYMPPAEASVKYSEYLGKALELDDLLAEAHTALAAHLTGHESDVEGAEREFKRAIDLNPSYATAHHWYANGFLGPQGRHDEAIKEMREAKRLDPLSPMVTANLGDQLASAGRIKEAQEQYREVLEALPRFVYPRYQLAASLLKEARYEEAISEIQTARAFDDLNGQGTAGLIYAYSITGRREAALALLEELELRASRGYISNVILAMANGSAGKKERALELLEKAAAERSNQLRMNLPDPSFDALRSDPRFQALLKAVGLVK